MGSNRQLFKSQDSISITCGKLIAVKVTLNRVNLAAIFDSELEFSFLRLRVVTRSFLEPHSHFFEVICLIKWVLTTSDLFAVINGAAVSVLVERVSVMG